ncbi:MULTISPECIES: VanZ family protein [unclassified Paenibacillus]|uniref:VanZ family protein n=1 Tax=unclassified Paenibacillus TaxID=185978 RepID=UPI0003F9051A|nr:MULTISPECIES: VanZ family protein [unclassified Paenibacillus]CDN41777.1 Uncharacterized protein BN871_AL_00240 [Paenibacillus sp. P22]
MNKNCVPILLWSMAAVYVLLMAELLFLREGDGLRSFNLIPFHTIQEYMNADGGMRRNAVDVNIWGNILLFVPAGIYAMLIGKSGSIWPRLAAVALLSAGVEAGQYILAAGAADIDDVILNSTGGLIGITIYSVLKLGLRKQERVKLFLSLLSAGVGVPVLILSLVLYAVNRV